MPAAEAGPITEERLGAILKDERAEMLAAVRDILGTEVVERMEQADERIARLDARIEELPATGTQGDFRRMWLGRRASPRPMVAPHDLSDDEVLDWGRKLAAKSQRQDYITVAGRQLPGQGMGDDIPLDALMGMRVWRCMAAGLLRRDGRVSHSEALALAREWGDRELVEAVDYTADLVEKLQGGDREAQELAQRALGTKTLGSGASLIVPEYGSSIIDYLHAQAVVLSMGVQSIPLASGKLSFPYFDTAITVTMVGEASGPNESSPQDKRLNLVRKTQAATMALSKELVRESSYDIDAWVLRHMAAAAAEHKDGKLLRGENTEHSPRGAKYWAEQATTGGEAHKFDRTLSGGVPTVQTITNDAIKAMRLVEESRAPQLSNGWVAQTRTYYGLMAERNSTTQMEIWPELRGGTWYGHPIRRTPIIPRNLAGDASGNGTGNKTELYYAAWGNDVHAQAEALEINAYDGGAYNDSSGNVRSGITNREVVYAMDNHFDYADTYRGKSHAMIDSVDYGA